MHPDEAPPPEPPPSPRPSDDDPVPRPARRRAKSGPIPDFISERIAHILDGVARASRRADGSIRRRVLYPLYAARVLIQVVKQWALDRCPQQASSLAFQTALSLVPLVALGLVLLRLTGAFEAQSTLVAFLSDQVLPISRDEIAKTLLDWAGNLSARDAGLAGVSTMLLLSFFLYSSVEHIFNDIWRVERRRSLTQKFVIFYAVATIVPALFAFSLYHAARFGLTSGGLGILASLGATFTALLFANKLLPAVRVRWTPAAAGALLSALAFELAKNLYRLYIAKVAFQRYAGIYGTLGLVPITLIWIYYSWLVILLGAEVAHTTQNLQSLEGHDRRSHQDPERQVSGIGAARVLAAIVEKWRAGGHATPRVELVTRFDLHEDAADRILRRLREGGLILEIDGDTTGYLPARPPADITLAQVLQLFRADATVSPLGSGPRTRVDDVLAEIEGSTRERARTITLEELTRP